MARSISIYRRKPNLVDLLVRRRIGKKGFRFSAASNFDSSFIAFATVPNYGVKSRNVKDVYSMTVGDQFRDQMRFLFDPSDYVTTAPALIDTSPFFLKIEAQNQDGTFDAAEAMHLVLPPSIEPRRIVNLRGTIPIGAAISNSLEIQLPSQCYDFQILNDGAANLFVAFHPSGGEYQVFQVSTTYTEYTSTLSAATQIFLRGSGGSTTVSLSFTLRNDAMI